MRDPRHWRAVTRRPRVPAGAPSPDYRRSEIRAALDAFRRIVHALRTGGGRRGGLTSAQVFALQRIADHPHSSVNDIAALTFTHQSSVSAVIQRLVRRRLVVSVTVPADRRRQSLALTAAGRRVLRDAPIAIQDRLIAAIGRLPVADRRALARSLDAIARAVAPDPAAHPSMFFEDSVRRGRSN